MTADDVFEEQRERAAIMEYDGEMNRRAAESISWELMAAKYDRPIVAEARRKAMV